MFVDDSSFENFGDGPMLSCVRDELGGAMDVMSAENHVDIWGSATHTITIFLRKTPGNNDLATLFLVFPCFEMAEIAVLLVVSIFSNAARVEDDDVGIILIARLFISVSR